VELLQKEKTFGALVVILEMKESLSPVYWLNILDPTCPLLAVIEHTNMVPRDHYQGEVITYLAKYLDPSEPLFSKSDGEVLKFYLAQLKRVYPQFRENMVLRSHVMRDPFAQPVVTLGYGKRIPSHRTPVEGLYLATMSQVFPDDRGMSLSVGLGEKVARMLDLDLRKRAQSTRPE
jgi:protoporphyrinogen oxidase